MYTDDDSETSSVCIGTTYAPSLNQVFAQPKSPNSHPSLFHQPIQHHWLNPPRCEYIGNCRCFCLDTIRNQSSEPSLQCSHPHHHYRYHHHHRNNDNKNYYHHHHPHHPSILPIPSSLVCPLLVPPKGRHPCIYESFSIQAVEQGELLGQQVLWHPPLRPRPSSRPGTEAWSEGGGWGWPFRGEGCIG